MTLKKKLLACLIAVAVLAVIWFVCNPPGRFGWSGFAYATFNSRPRLIADFQVRSDGATRTVDKTHQLTVDHIEWLLDPQPEVLIIALGWDGVTTPNERIRQHQGCELHLLKNKEAIELFNRLKRSGKRVAIHYHSTC